MHVQSISISYNFYFQFFQMPVADKYTELDIALMLHNYFHQLFIENQSLFDRKWRVCVCVCVYRFSKCTYPWQKTIHGIPTWIKQEVVNLGAWNYVTNSRFLKTEQSKFNLSVHCTIKTNVA